MVISWPHIHLVLNHFPVLGSIFGLVLFGSGMYLGNEDIKKAALYTLVITAAFAGLTFLTGDQAADAVRGIECVSKDAIHRHDDFAGYSMSASIALGLLSAAFLYISRGGKLDKKKSLIVLIAAAAVSGAMGWTAELGGMIHHQELRPGFISPAVKSDINEG